MENQINENEYMAKCHIASTIKMVNANDMFNLLNKTIKFMNDPDATDWEAHRIATEIQSLINHINKLTDSIIEK